jgi:hypothetical protein
VAGPWEKYAAPQAGAGPWAKYGGQTAQPQGMPLAPDAWGRAKQAYEGTLPLLDENMATLAGVGSIARGVTGAVKGGYNTLKTAMQAWNDPKAEVGDTILPQPQVGQVRGAIRDINASPDPAGSYLNAAGETAGQGAGAALTALGTEGAMRGSPRLAEAVQNAPFGRMAQAGGAALRGGAAKVPIVGPIARGALRSMVKSWEGSAPTPTIDPALSTEARTLPGMNSPEVIRPPAAPIPPRQGLMLPGGTEPQVPPSAAGRLVDAVRGAPPSNMPTPASRAASDAAFMRNYPPEDVPDNWGLDLHEKPQAPGPDLGDRVRAANPEPTRAEVALGRARQQAAVLGQPSLLDRIRQSAASLPPDEPTSYGRPLRIEGQDVPADIDLTSALQRSLQQAGRNRPIQ